MFFLRRREPLALGAGQLEGLRLSLNTPVVATSDLPAGPARAAILLHRDSRRGLMLTVGVRSLGCGSVVLYGFEGQIERALANEAIDAALSFAEGMGFLFDDELVRGDPRSREKALTRWREAIGDGEGSLPPVGAEPEPEIEPALDLFDLAGSDLTDPPVMAALPPTTHEIDLPAAALLPGTDEALADPAELDFQPAADASPTLPLTKFRPRTDTTPSPRGAETDAPRRAAGKRALGRVRLERRRLAPPVQDARRGWLLRLFTSF